METELKAAATVSHASPGKALARDLFVAYVAAWGVGILYGALIRAHVDVGRRRRVGAQHAPVVPSWTLPSWLDAVVLQIPLTGTNLTILPLTLAIGLWLWKRKRRGIIALQLLIVTVGSLSLNPTMKYMLGRDRPDLFARRGMYNWASYPSGHAILTIAVYLTVALLLYRTRGWRWPFVLAAGGVPRQLRTRGSTSPCIGRRISSGDCSSGSCGCSGRGARSRGTRRIAQHSVSA